MHTIPAIILLFCMFIGYHMNGYHGAVYVAVGFAAGALLLNWIRGK